MSTMPTRRHSAATASANLLSATQGMAMGLMASQGAVGEVCSGGSAATGAGVINSRVVRPTTADVCSHRVPGMRGTLALRWAGF